MHCLRKEKSVINHHIFQNATRFVVNVDEDQGRLPTFYWLPKLHKQPYTSRFIANSSSCTTTKLSKLLTSCLTTIKKHVIDTVKKSVKGPVKSRNTVLTAKLLRQGYRYNTPHLKPTKNQNKRVAFWDGQQSNYWGVLELVCGRPIVALVSALVHQKQLLTAKTKRIKQKEKWAAG